MKQSLGVSLMLGRVLHDRRRPSRTRPAFSITRAEAIFSTSHTAPIRNTKSEPRRSRSPAGAGQPAAARRSRGPQHRPDPRAHRYGRYGKAPQCSGRCSLCVVSVLIRPLDREPCYLRVMRVGVEDWNDVLDRDRSQDEAGRPERVRERAFCCHSAVPDRANKLRHVHQCRANLTAETHD
jgi:hypothetical protein